MSPTLLREATPKARKPHDCSMCTGPIQPGEVYSRDTLVYDGQIYDWLTCPACHDDSIMILAWDWSVGYHDEGIDSEVAHEWATEQVIHGAPDEQAAAKRYLERWGTS